MSDTDLHAISTIENPVASVSRGIGASSDDSSQSSAPAMTGLVQPQQPHWPQHNTGSHNHHHLHSGNYILDGDDDPDDFEYDEFTGGSGPATPAGPASPVSASFGRSKRGGSTKRTSQISARKNGNRTCHYFSCFNILEISLSFIATSNPSGTSGAHSTSNPTGNRRQQYTLAELPFVCEFCPARYKTKPGLQYHLAKHKESNNDYRPPPSTPSTADSCGSAASPSSATAQVALMKHKYMNPSTDHHLQQPHPIYSSHPVSSGPPSHNTTSGTVLH
jgi:hypothetical protein